MDSNTFQLKMLGKSLLKLTLIMMAASAFIDKTGFFETLMKKYLLKAPKSRDYLCGGLHGRFHLLPGPLPDLVHRESCV